MRNVIAQRLGERKTLAQVQALTARVASLEQQLGV